MTEVELQVIAGLKLLTVAIFGLIYSLGGMFGTPIRRVGGSLFLTSAIVGFSIWTNTFSWWYTACALLFWGSFSLGYGTDDDNIVGKIVLRFMCGCAYAFAAIPIAIVSGIWLLYIFHVLLCISSSVFFGVLNPFNNARNEEACIGVSIALLPLFMV